MTEDTEKEELLNVFFASVFTTKASSQEYQNLVATEKVWRKKYFPLFEDDWARDHSDKHDMHKSLTFESSWEIRDVPYDWRNASATPVFLGDPGSYRLSSLIWGNIFPWRVTEYWNRFPRGVVECPLEIHLDQSCAICSRWTCFSRGVGIGHLQ